MNVKIGSIDLVSGRLPKAEAASGSKWDLAGDLKKLSFLGEGTLSGGIRLREPCPFLSVMPEVFAAEVSEGLSECRLKDLVCFAESIDGDHFTSPNSTTASQFFLHSAGCDLERFDASVHHFFKAVKRYRDPVLDGLPHYFESIDCDKVSYTPRDKTISNMSPEAILDALSEIVIPDFRAANDDAFIASLDAMHTVMVLTKQETYRTGKKGHEWWLQLIVEQIADMSALEQYCKAVEALGFRE